MSEGARKQNIGEYLLSTEAANKGRISENGGSLREILDHELYRFHDENHYLKVADASAGMCRHLWETNNEFRSIIDSELGIKSVEQAERLYWLIGLVHDVGNCYKEVTENIEIESDITQKVTKMELIEPGEPLNRDGHEGRSWNFLNNIIEGMIDTDPKSSGTDEVQEPSPKNENPISAEIRAVFGGKPSNSAKRIMQDIILGTKMSDSEFFHMRHLPDGKRIPNAGGAYFTQMAFEQYFSDKKYAVLSLPLAFADLQFLLPEDAANKLQELIQINNRDHGASGDIKLLYSNFSKTEAEEKLIKELVDEVIANALLGDFNYIKEMAPNVDPSKFPPTIRKLVAELMLNSYSLFLNLYNDVESPDPQHNMIKRVLIDICNEINARVDIEITEDQMVLFRNRFEERYRTKYKG